MSGVTIHTVQPDEVTVREQFYVDGDVGHDDGLAHRSFSTYDEALSHGLARMGRDPRCQRFYINKEYVRDSVVVTENAMKVAQ